MAELHEEKGYPIRNLCRVIGVSHSGYYKWKGRKPSDEEAFNAFLASEMKDIFAESDSTFGVIRMQTAIYCELGIYVNVKRVRRIMRILEISSVIRRKREGYVKSIPEHTAENIIDRYFTATAPNQKWFTDVTYLKAGGVKYYLSAIIDVYDMTLVSRKISNRNDNPEVLIIPKFLTLAHGINELF